LNILNSLFTEKLLSLGVKGLTHPIYSLLEQKKNS